MRNKYLRPTLGLLVIGLLSGTAAAQTPSKAPLSATQYQQMKDAGQLPQDFSGFTMEAAPAKDAKPPKGTAKGGGNVCDCWIAPDATYTLAMAPNDDGSSAAIPLPFSYNLYGVMHNTAYINNNGNVSFGSSYGTFTSSGFPSSQYAMVAPFWADVDTRPAGGGQVWYKVTPTALYVSWVAVGYYSMMTDKLNSFQLIITDGNDPVIGIGKNTSFCYQDMQWTTGSASGGTGGFGGTAATVGANIGNGVDYIQFGRFDQPGMAYDGPLGANDGVDWLDYKNFVFTTTVSTSNIPPIGAGAFLCDTLQVCAGLTVDLDMQFLAPEPGQTTTAITYCPTIASYTVTSNTPGNTCFISGSMTPTPAEVGFHMVTFEATDNGAPPLTAVYNIVVEVLPPAANLTPATLNTCDAAGTTDLITLFTGNPPGTGDWTDPNGAVHSGILDPATDPAGVYLYSIGSGGLCPTTGTITVTIQAQPDAGLDNSASYCTVDPVVDLFTLLLGSPQPGGTWVDPNNAAHSGQLDPATDPSGAYVYTINGVAPCTNSSATVQITINTPMDPGTDATLPLCTSDPVADLFLALGGTPDPGGSWTFAGLPATGTFDPLADTPGAYTYTVDPGAPCPTLSAVVTVTIDPVPDAGTDAVLTICADGPSTNLFALLGGTPDAGGAWLDPNAAVHNGTLDPGLELSGDYTYVATGIGACAALTDTSIVAVTVDPLPVIAFSAMPVEGCDPLNVQFMNQTDPQFIGTCAWDFGDGTTGSNCAPFFHGFSNPGTYTVSLTVTTPQGCVDVLTQTDLVHVTPAPEATFTANPNPASVEQSTVLLTATDPNAVAWNWTIGDLGTSTDQEVGFEFPNTLGGVYLVCLEVLDQWGCYDQQCRNIIVKDPLQVFVPNSFTPNGDGTNDVFFASVAGYDQEVQELLVFDRWGELIYDSQKFSEGWNGAYQNSGDVLPTGVYVWKLRVKAADSGERKEYIGSVTLLK